MEYGKIIAVTGLPGLFELLNSKNDGAIVRSLEDKSTKFVSSRIHNFSHLETIEVFTVRDNVNLSEIFLAMEKDGGKAPDAKDGAALKKYFQKVFPDIDFERVYASDLKKMAKWYEVLKENNIEIKLSERPVEEAPEEAEPGKAEKPEEETGSAAEAKPQKAEKQKAASAEPKTGPKAEAPAKPEPKAKAPVKAETKKAAPPAKTEKESPASAKTAAAAKAGSKATAPAKAEPKAKPAAKAETKKAAPKKK